MGNKHSHVPPPAPRELPPQKHDASRPSEEKRLHWKLFTDLENREEAEVQSLSAFLDALHQYMPDLRNSDELGLPPNSPLSLKASCSSIIISNIDITHLYKGVHLSPVISLENVMEMIESFRRGILLHEKYVLQICQSIIEYTQTLPNVAHVEVAPADHITVIGDLHGQVEDLLLIFRENGLPSETNPYIFNGDLVDRGHNSIEILCLIYCFQLLYPKSVYVNRGNHEDRTITTMFGFMKECQTKYNLTVYEAFVETFSWLPIATVIDDRVLVVHGGIGKGDMLLTELDHIPRFNYELARTQVQASTKLEKLALKPLMLVRDLIWSDPQATNGLKANKRGAGYNYGPDVTEKFLRRNKLKMIIRSHECVPNGFSWPYGKKGMLVTLFSASNYCGVANNQGAFVHVSADPTKGPQFFQYMASSTERDIVAENLDALIAVICEHREDLEAAFKKKDPDVKGIVSVAQWCECMEEVMELQFDWSSILPLLSSLDENNQVAYNQFLDRYTVLTEKEVDSSQGEQKPLRARRRREVFNALYKHRAKMEALFRTFDQDGDGVISSEEFEQGLNMLNKHLPANMSQFTNHKELMELLDFEQDNSINYNEFLEAFRINAKWTAQAKWRRMKSKLKAVSAFGFMKSVGEVHKADSSEE